MLTILLIKKIIQLFIYIGLGFLLVRLGIVKSSDSKTLSRVMVYILVPAATLSIFQVTVSQEVLRGLGFCFAVVIAVNILLVLMATVLTKPLSLVPAERGNAIYPNAVNMIIPLVTYMLGEEWLIFTMPFMVVQNVLLFTHGTGMFSGEKISIKRIVWNAPIISAVIGMAMMLSGVLFPDVISIPLAEMKGMLGPIAMLIAGMLMGGTSIPAMLKNKRIYLVLLLRLILFPLVVLALLVLADRLFALGSMVEDAHKILLVIFLASSAPCASLITQFAQLYSDEGEYSSAINILSTLSCIITMPVMVSLFELML